MRPISLKNKMTATISLLIAGLLSILALSTHLYFTDQIKGLLYTQQFSMVSALADQIDDKFRLSQAELVATARTLKADALRNPHNLQSFFDQRPGNLTMFDNGLFLFSAQGTLLSGNPLDSGIIGKNFLYRDYLKKTLATKQPFVSAPFISAQTHRHPIIMLTAPVLDEKGDVAAVLAGSIDLAKDNFITKVGKITLGEKGYLYLYSPDRVMIAHPDSRRIFKQDVPLGKNRLYDEAIEGFEGTGETTNSRGLHVISSFKRLQTTNWILASNFPQQEAYAPIYRARSYILAALFVVFLISMLVVWLCTKFLTAPLISFTEQIRMLTQNKEGETAPVNIAAGDEIGVLGEAFNQLLKELQQQKFELKRQLEFSQKLLEVTPIPVFYKGADGRYLGCNQAFLDFTGLTRERVIGKTVFDVTPGPLAQVHHRSDQELISGGGLQVYESKTSHVDQAERDVIFFKTSFTAANGACGGVLGVMLDITEHKKAEADLQSQKEFAESLVLNMTQPTFVLDCEHRVIMWNRALETLTGIKPGEVLGSHHLGKIFYEADRPVLADLVLDGNPDEAVKYYSNYRKSSLIEGGVQAEGWYEDPDGKGHYITLNAAQIRDRQGRVVGAIQSLEDITERKQAEDAHEKTRRQLQLILDAAGEGINGVDMQGRITFVNPAAAQMVGWTQEELLGQHQHSLMHHTREDGSPFPEQECPLSAACYDGRPYQGSDELFWRKDGSSFYAEYNCRPLREGGELVGAVVVYKDVTERRQADEQLLKLSQAVMQSPVAIIITDATGKIEFVNPRFTEVAGYTSDEVIGQNPRILQSGRTSPELYQGMWDTITSGRVWTGELYNRHKNGTTFWQHATISPILNSSGTISHFMAFMESIGDRKKLEEQLRQAQKMEAIGQLAGGVAHDFNNILTVILGFGQLLQHSLPKGDPMLDHMEQILDAADRATHLTRSLLAFSRKQVMVMQQVELNELTRRHAKFLVRIIGEDVTLKTSFSNQELLVMADSGQLEQVLMNLATNARDAMPTGGELTIKTELVTLDKEFHRQYGYGVPGRYALITVADSGTGMDAETQQKIFEPFFTTKLPGRGTGLGMSIVYGIIKQHGGYITVFSQVGFGTTFSIYLPLITEKVQPSEKPATFIPEGGSETILVVEDDAAVGRLVESVLKRYGYQVILASSGDDALHLFESRWQEISLALLDVIMPKMNGKQLCEELRRLSPQLKVLFLSGYTADIIQDKGIFLEEGVDIIKKPARPIELARKVREMLDT
ncbi:PAS domain S-box protein [Geomonas sp. Red69]|uniref:histidine kinase n=1 Tax=Geomonas diazotrophica TaxID=2843197 RepID=A0ABX8JM43_9BACT|nr:MULTISPECIES: PAS domain S-box protein [Geomonas]MBU5637515.1 PAS domain S-box protein [Geomonas diazotrophica]QWV99363.1 PAS domain S-box protein [Geomonas nitrogeniifigens]